MLLNRLVDSVITVILVVTLVFVAMRILPGDPAVAALGDSATAEQLASFRERMGLNVPLWHQYLDFLVNIVTLNFGTSMITGENISAMLLANLPYTVELTVAAMIIGMIIGVPIGVLSAVKRGSFPDYIARIIALAGFCIPDFFLGALILIVFGLKLDLFPVTGGGTDFPSRMQHLVLPAMTLGLVMAAFTSRLTRSALLEVLKRDYIRTARAKGVTERWVIYKHALRNALIPVVTGFGIYILTMLSGSIAIELIFARPGVGSVLINGINSRDYPMVQAGLLVFALFVVVVNIAMDLLYVLIDPRLRRAAR
ncbi:peptide/nickel transport system permease protein [Phyllobacterium trifolii]|jgi:peptide/nickel transport system permease protein|uniref:Peptide/nickel transport system permease protein n=1 Tax=Phyllobacterium trifolii TaxID=300193 RepID=A0A839UEH1_9HYPH|nr:ABC transporter permease [Phyllobacterium trifolii]MBB3149518.1 peptide/nickel transport system permease protein [Phyllobacterium trifolii]